jgi:hypothetical protein
VTTLLAIDPGSAGEGNACALYVGGELVGAWFARYQSALPWGQCAGVRLGTVVIERPAYQGARSDAARVQDLIALAWSGALLAGAYAGRDGAELVEHTPNDVRDPRCPRHGRMAPRLVRDPVAAARVAARPCTCKRGWKGSEQKPVHHARLLEVLAPAELEVLGGGDTARRILAARQKGALDRWGKPGATYYGAWTGHNLLDAAALGAYHLGRLGRK